MFECIGRPPMHWRRTLRSRSPASWKTVTSLRTSSVDTDHPRLWRYVYSCVCACACVRVCMCVCVCVCACDSVSVVCVYAVYVCMCFCFSTA